MEGQEYTPEYNETLGHFQAMESREFPPEYREALKRLQLLTWLRVQLHSYFKERAEADDRDINCRVEQLRDAYEQLQIERVAIKVAMEQFLKNHQNKSAPK